MTCAGPQLAPDQAAVAKQRSPLQHLLHALNQPLTGLQCSLELALAGHRTREHYIRILNEGLELTTRARLLVEAIRELTELQPGPAEAAEIFRLDAVVEEIADELRPVAEARGVALKLPQRWPLPVWTKRAQFAQVLFRVLESGLSLADRGTALRIAAGSEPKYGLLTLSWTETASPESPFSRAELGLFLAQQGCEKLGAEWAEARNGQDRTCTIRFALASAENGAMELR